jgi:hypothetical protein
LAYEHWLQITSDAIPNAGNNTIYTLDDLETKISAQIKQAIHLDNVTLHQQYKYQTGKRVPKLLSKSITAQQITQGKKPHQ